MICARRVFYESKPQLFLIHQDLSRWQMYWFIYTLRQIQNVFWFRFCWNSFLMVQLTKTSLVYIMAIFWTNNDIIYYYAYMRNSTWVCLLQELQELQEKIWQKLHPYMSEQNKFISNRIGLSRVIFDWDKKSSVKYCFKRNCRCYSCNNAHIHKQTGNILVQGKLYGYCGANLLSQQMKTYNQTINKALQNNFLLGCKFFYVWIQEMQHVKYIHCHSMVRFCFTRRMFQLTELDCIRTFWCILL